MVFLDRKSKKVLKAVIKARNKINFVNGSELLVPLLPKMPINLINESLWHLHDIKLLVCEGGIDEIYNISIPYESVNRREFIWIKFKQFIFKSILTPILVSITTTLIALWVKGFFK